MLNCGKKSNILMKENLFAFKKYKLLELFPLLLEFSYPPCLTLASH